MSDGIVYVIDDDAEVRDSMKRLFASVDLAVKTFGSAPECLDAIDLRLPCCVVTDVRMPEMSGLKLQEALKARSADVPIIMITGFPEVPQAVRAMKAGAIDFVQKPVEPQEMIERVQRALERDRERRRIQSDRESIAERARRLTPREREVVALVLDGFTSREIAKKLDVAVKTIHAHRSNAMKKMGASSAAQLAHLIGRSRDGEA